MKYTRVLLLPLIITAPLNSMEKELSSKEIKQQWEIVKTFNNTGYVSTVNISRDAKLLVTACNVVHVFNMDKNKEILSFDAKEGVSAISIHNDLIATGSGDGIARVRDINKPKKMNAFQNKYPIRATKLHDNGYLLATAGKQTARIFDLRTHEKIVDIEHEDQTRSVCFKNDNNHHVITASFDTVRLFDIRKIEEQVEDKIKEKTVPIEIYSINREKRNIVAVLTNTDNGIVTLEIPFITMAGADGGTWIPTKREPGDTAQIYNDITKETIDTGICATIDTTGGPIDKFFERKELFFSIDLHQEDPLIVFGFQDKALVFAPKNQQ